MYQTINGYTRESMKAKIKLHNNGTPAMKNNGCVYLTADGNRCSVGCFIPDDHPGLNEAATARTLLKRHPDLENIMPLSVNGLIVMQSIHDDIGIAESQLNTVDALFKWIDTYVIDTLPTGSTTVEKN